MTRVNRIALLFLAAFLVFAIPANVLAETTSVNISKLTEKQKAELLIDQ